MIRGVGLFFVCFFFSGVALAGFYEGGDDFDPSFQEDRVTQAFPPEATSQEVNYSEPQEVRKPVTRSIQANAYGYDLPQKIQTTEKLVLVDPKIHAWGAYNSNGELIRAGRATSGGTYCPDIDRGCKTHAGTFRVYSLGSEDCVSSKYPIDEGGGAPMPYCMYFNGSQGLHGSNHVVDGNISHGCVRLRVSDAEWLRFNFVNIGTKVVVKPY